MLKLYIDESYLFTEAIADIKKYYPNIPDDTFMQLISLDPTYRGNDSAGKYGKWILNLYNKGRLSEEEFDEVTPLLNQFTTYRNRVQNKDLNSYKSLDALSDVLASVIDDDSMLTDRQKLRFLKNVKLGKIKTNAENDYDTVYEDSNWVVWVPNTHEASMKLGNGTDWCTAHENPEWYNTYTYEDGEEFSLYIMKNKKTGERFQYCDNPYRGYDYQFMDEYDDDVDVLTFMSYCDDDKFIEFLHKLNPNFFKNIKCVNDLMISNNVAIGTADYFEPDVIVPDGVKVLDTQLFYRSDYINSIYIPDSLERIDSYVFTDSTLQQINLDDAYSLTSIGTSAFKFCRNLEQILILPNVEVIDDDAFAYSGITKIYIGDSISTLGERIFYECENLTDVEIEGCKNSLVISELTFGSCHNLKTVYLPENIREIDDKAFDNCGDELTIYSDSQWLRDNIEQFNINLYNSNEEPIYIKDKGFVD